MSNETVSSAVGFDGDVEIPVIRRSGSPGFEYCAMMVRSVFIVTSKCVVPDIVPVWVTPFVELKTVVIRRCRRRLTVVQFVLPAPIDER